MKTTRYYVGSTHVDIRSVLSTLARLAGGATVVSGAGAWVDELGTLCLEPVNVYCVGSGSLETRDACLRALFDAHPSEKAIAVEANGDMWIATREPAQVNEEART